MKLLSNIYKDILCIVQIVTFAVLEAMAAWSNFVESFRMEVVEKKFLEKKKWKILRNEKRNYGTDAGTDANSSSFSLAAATDWIPIAVSISNSQGVGQDDVLLRPFFELHLFLFFVFIYFFDADKII